MTDDLRNPHRAVAALHGCGCANLSTARVHEMMNGKTVWKGEVEVFDLTGDPKADKAFAWSWRDDAGEIRYIAVLNAPPISSPREAVQAAITSGKQKYSGFKLGHYRKPRMTACRLPGPQLRHHLPTMKTPCFVLQALLRSL